MVKSSIMTGENAALKMHVGTDEKHDITKYRPNYVM